MTVEAWHQGAASVPGGDRRSRSRTSTRILTEARDVVEPAHRAAVDRLPEQLRLVAGYHAGWWDVEGRPCAAAGKALRPALVLACARAAAGDRAAQAAEAVVRAAVAVELAHDFTLLHDDVMDGDRLRRHRPSAWTVFGVSQAILVGDALSVLALDVLADAALASVLSAALMEMCAGQSADLAFESRDEVALAECWTMAEGKTGALLGAACQLGALAVGADGAAAASFRGFGRNLGVAYQLVDDLLGIWGDPASTGKPAGSDLVARKKTLPVVAALTSGSQAGERLAHLYGRDEEWDEETVAHGAGLIETAGGRRWAKAEAGRRAEVALAWLRRADPDPAAAADLHTLTALITGRDR
ncbi:polyprenyl synthetase family protein [Actinomadura gamaensis]|uniref:Polyprenyl synthetase family protein n=1 Tax=Actinomadura gamaensis TaxID=1763541 RepID=A0ABV9TYG7_9ACTN